MVTAIVCWLGHVWTEHAAPPPAPAEVKTWKYTSDATCIARFGEADLFWRRSDVAAKVRAIRQSATGAAQDNLMADCLRKNGFADVADNFAQYKRHVISDVLRMEAQL